MQFGPIILLRVGPALGGPQGLVISIVIVYKVKHSEEIQISWLREPLEFPEDRLYTPHTAGSCSRATGIPGEDGAQWYGASQTPESGLCEFAFQSAESTSPYFSPHFFFFFLSSRFLFLHRRDRRVGRAGPRPTLRDRIRSSRQSGVFMHMHNVLIILDESSRGRVLLPLHPVE